MEMSLCSRRRGRSFKSSAPASAVLACANKHSAIYYKPVIFRKHTLFQRQSSDYTVHNTFVFMNYTDGEHGGIKITTSLVSCKLYKSHFWLWAQQLQEIDSHCFHMQLFTTTFLFTIILVALEGSISESREIMTTPMFVRASQNTTLVKPLWRWHYLQ